MSRTVWACLKQRDEKKQGQNTASASYVYDAAGRRVQTTVNGSTVDFAYDLAGREVAKYTPSVFRRLEVYNPHNGRHLVTYVNGLTFFDFQDQVGTERVKMTQDGTHYKSTRSLPFGDGQVGSGPDLGLTGPDHFTGQELDSESNLTHFWFRQFSATQGRWMSPDPAGAVAENLGDPQSWNRYLYALNNPLNLVDPLGLDTCYELHGWPSEGVTWTVPVYCSSGIQKPHFPPRRETGGSSGRRTSRANNKKNLFACASEFASKYSIAGGLQALGIGTSGVGGFITNALGGNAFSGATDLIQSIGSGEAGGHSVFYNMGQGIAAGPSQGFGAALGKSAEGTPWASGPVDVATTAILSNAQSIVTGTGQTIQTLNGAVELGTVLGEVGELASGFGEVKLAYDAASYGLGLAVCAAK